MGSKTSSLSNCDTVIEYQRLPQPPNPKDSQSTPDNSRQVDFYVYQEQKENPRNITGTRVMDDYEHLYLQWTISTSSFKHCTDVLLWVDEVMERDELIQYNREIH